MRFIILCLFFPALALAEHGREGEGKPRLPAPVAPVPTGGHSAQLPAQPERPTDMKSFIRSLDPKGRTRVKRATELAMLLRDAGFVDEAYLLRLDGHFVKNELLIKWLDKGFKDSDRELIQSLFFELQRLADEEIRR